MNRRTFFQAVMLIVIGVAAYFGGLYLWQRYQIHQLEAAMKVEQRTADDIFLNSVDAHIKACLKQGYKGGPLGC